MVGMKSVKRDAVVHVAGSIFENGNMILLKTLVHGILCQ